MRRGQVTLFIILGLVLVIGTILTVAIYNDWLTERPPDEYVVDEPTTELQPLLTMIEECQVRLLDEAVRQALLGGGYIDPEAHGIVSMPLPKGRGAATGSRTVPYWHYIEGGEARSERPELYSPYGVSVESQVSAYVDERLEECLDWDAFPQYTVTRTAPASAVAFREGRTVITTYMNASVDTAQGVKRFDTFTAEIPAPVSDLFRNAEDAIDGLRESRAPEWYLMQWLGIYAVGHTNDLPPLYGEIESGYDYKVWPVHSAQDDLADVISMMAERIQFVGTRDAEVLITGDDRVNSLYAEGLIPIEDAERTSIRAYSPAVEPYFTVNGNRGAAIPQVTRAPSLLGSFMPPVVDYRFAFDIAYPLILRLERDGYTLLVAYEANIDDNKAQDLSVVEETDFCEHPGGARLDLRLVSDVDAPVLFTCGADTCYLGETSEQALSTTLPACAAGQLEVYAPERFSDFVSVTSTAGETISETMRLYEPRPVQIAIQQRMVVPGVQDDYKLEERTSYPEGDHRIILARHGRPLPAQVDENGVVELVPGAYDVIVMRIAEIAENPVIPAEERCFDQNGNLLPGGEECITISEVNFTELPVFYLELMDDNAMVLNQVPDRLVLTGAGLRVEDLERVEDLGLLGALFDQGSSLLPEEAVTPEYT